MLRRLLTRRWLGALLAATVYAVLAYHLGTWQWGRYEGKAQRNARLDAHYAAAPVPLTGVLTMSPLPLDSEWTHVTATGRYGGQQLFVRNRPNDSVYGYEVVAPFVVDGGGTALVDRGWVQNSVQASVLPSVPAPPAGTVTVVGWVRTGEASLHRDLPAGQLASINLAEASRALGSPLLGGYVILDDERTATGGAPPRPQALAPPSRDLGPHQAYSVQWWGSMPVGLVLVFFGIRRELREEDPERPAKVKRPSIWEEEDID